ncbi:galactokinase [Xenorhabdus sp. 42]|uniref:Galactokinase n=1 Tax=Xenorhabdus szentirmaii DSM 16338 TaxID=1427518 RepID=W1J7V4_9GAMM|nr:galactokinase [Xenorhabdus sp. 42]PHM35309.1 galactokinase [Xenorhabdus szentirmaii DSM 16338]PHM44111.1 galactokinase [Xenorhabdus szentirmaii]CDL85570.1 Galactokinase [Xenorhabdus szentirmaii DSM 16338]
MLDTARLLREGIVIEALIQKVARSFNAYFHYPPAHFFQSPGRVNLIGEHTDYNDGFVLPCAISYYTVVGAARREDTKIRIIAVDYHNECDEFDLSEPVLFQSGKMWANYIRGVVKSLADGGYAFKGMDIAVSGNIPQGAGLSSSASLEVVIGQTINALYQLNISAKTIALHGQQSENRFVGCHSGIMDQLISACGTEKHALLIDCRSLETQAIPMPDNMAVMIINSNKPRKLAGSEYNTRRQQCEEAACFFGVTALRDVSFDEFSVRQAQLNPLLAKRARHVITENLRTLAAADALRAGNLLHLGQLMAESHISMRDDFDITVHEVNVLVTIVKNVIGEYGGVRMTGGGFGGCVVALFPPDLVESVKRAIEHQYEAKTGLNATVYHCQAVNGMCPASPLTF